MADTELASIAEDTTPDPTDVLYMTDAAGTTDKRVPLSALPSSAELLGAVSYRPASAYTSTTTAAKDLDATNLTVSFTIPASGAVLLRLTGFANAPTSGQEVLWMMRDTGGSTISGSEAVVDVQDATYISLMSHAVKITGLTPGATTWRWGWSQTSTNTATVGYANKGYLTIEVWAAA